MSNERSGLTESVCNKTLEDLEYTIDQYYFSVFKDSEVNTSALEITSDRNESSVDKTLGVLENFIDQYYCSFMSSGSLKLDSFERCLLNSDNSQRAKMTSTPVDTMDNLKQKNIDSMLSSKESTSQDKFNPVSTRQKKKKRKKSFS